MRNRPHTSAVIGIATAALSLLFSTAAYAAATTVSVATNANSSQNTNGGTTNVNAAALLNGPVGDAAAAAALTAQSPEMQAAVKSVWRLAFDAFWNFLKRAVSTFFGLFTSSVTVDLNSNAANVNTAANVNAGSNTNQP